MVVDSPPQGDPGKDRDLKMIEMEFIGGPLDGPRPMAPEEIRPFLRIPVQLYGVYALRKKDAEEERVLTTLNLSPEEISQQYHYLWIPTDNRGKTVPA
jgi:hypothetical protein